MKEFSDSNEETKSTIELLNGALNELDNKFERLIERLPNFYFQSDSNGIIIKVSDYTVKLLGYQKSIIIGLPLAELFVSHNEYAQTLSRVMDNRGRETDLEASFRCKDKSSVRVSMLVTATFNSQQHFQGIEAIAASVAVKSTLNGEKNQAAIRDPMTTLINQLAFSEHLSKSIRTARRYHSQLRVLYVNLQNLEEIAEIFGITVSQQCLVHFSRRLQSFFRDTDVVARIGEENFAVLLDDYADENILQSLIERLLKVMDKKTSIQQYPYGFAINIGVANFPNDGINSTDLISFAESNMYRFKFSKHNLLIQPSKQSAHD